VAKGTGDVYGFENERDNQVVSFLIISVSMQTLRASGVFWIKAQRLRAAVKVARGGCAGRKFPLFSSLNVAAEAATHKDDL
jgi:hypothetical protein